MRFTRSSGILLHPTSLPGRFGVGDLGTEAYRFVDWLAAAGQRLWQIMPLGPTGYGDSPYMSFSAFAGNTNLVSPEELVKDKLLDESDLDGAGDFPAGRVDYGRVVEYKRGLLEKAFANFKAGAEEGISQDYVGFKELVRPKSYDFVPTTGEVDQDGDGTVDASVSAADFTFASLRGNAVLRWEYLPGSTMYLVWTQSRSASEDIAEFRPGRSFDALVDAKADNIFLVKVSYWWNP